MYTVQIYCTVPDYVELDEEKKYALRHYKLDSFVTETFDSLDSLYYYVRSFDYVDSRYEVVKNHFLNAVMCSEKETRRHANSFDSRISYRSRFEFVPLSGDDCYYLGYIVRTEKGRILDLRNYKKDLYKFDVEAYREKLCAERHRKYDECWSDKEARWEKDKKLYALPEWYGYFRSISTMPEKRMSVHPEHKPFVRGRRSCNQLPDSWDDIGYCWTKNWKRRDRKARKQWETNLKKHIDTVKDAEGAVTHDFLKSFCDSPFLH